MPTRFGTDPAFVRVYPTLIEAVTNFGKSRDSGDVR
jgi:hypothetical protein